MSLIAVLSLYPTLQRQAEAYLGHGHILYEWAINTEDGWEDHEKVIAGFHRLNDLEFH